MIPKPVLKTLVKRSLFDADILLNNHRYTAAVYLSGYALEIALKYCMCRVMAFNNGFPESKTEFNSYYTDTRKILLGTTIRELKDIRHHN